MLDQLESTEFKAETKMLEQIKSRRGWGTLLLLSLPLERQADWVGSEKWSWNDPSSSEL
jgi:hypothetical protein